MNTKELITRTIASLLLPFALVACDVTDDIDRDEGNRAEIVVCMDHDLECGSVEESLVDDPDAHESPSNGSDELEGPGSLAALPDHQEPVASATMNCNTGSCRCTNMTYNDCVSACDQLWDANCSKPAAQQQLWEQ